MTIVRSVVSHDLRVIMCIAFDHRAPTDEVAAFKQALIDCQMVLHSVELTGAFDFMIEAALPDIATYHAWLGEIKGQLARLVSRYETNFVCKRFVRSPEQQQEHAVWVPCVSGLKRLDCSVIDRVTAEGDYMRIHSGKDSWLVHATMRELLNQLGDDDFVHVHRSSIIRCAFIERLIHAERHWDARLQDGTVQRIAKSHVSAVLQALRIGSAKRQVFSATDAPTDENGVIVNDKIMHKHL